MKAKKRSKHRGTLVPALPLLLALALLLCACGQAATPAERITGAQPSSPEAAGEEAETPPPPAEAAEEPEDDGVLRIEGLELHLEQGVLRVDGSGTLPALRGFFLPEELESITAVELGPELRGLGDGALAGLCHLRSITLPSQLEEIGEAAFLGCSSLESVECDSPAFLLQDGLLLSADGSRLIFCPKTLPNPHGMLTPWTRVTVPEGVREIAAGAFADCVDLTSVQLPASLVRIGEDAFRGCEDLNYLSLPAGLEEIGEGAFSYCVELHLSLGGNEHFKLDGPVLYTADGRLLLWCQMGELGSFTVPEGVERIGREALMGCDIGALRLPDSLRSIGEQAFYSCMLTEIEIPAGVTEIGEGMLRGNNFLVRIRVEEGNSAYCAEDNVLYSADKTQLLCYAAGNYARDFRVPESVTRIAAFAFTGFRLLGTLSIPAGVTDISDEAFRHCYGVSAIQVAEDNPSYCSADGVLYDREMQRLLRYPSEKQDESFVLPESVVSIAPYACNANSELQSIRLPEGLRLIGTEAFCDCDELRQADLPESLLVLGNASFRNCALTQIRIPAGVRVVGSEAFRSCEEAASLVFMSCPDYLGDAAFRRCDSLSEAALPEGLTVVPRDLFSFCGALEKVSLPDSILRIERAAFEDCALVELRLPAQLEQIGPDAFRSCNDLETVYFDGTLAQWEPLADQASMAGLRWANILCSDGAWER